VIRFLRVGWRLGRPASPADWTRLALLATTSLLTVVAVLGMNAAHQLIDRHQNIADARTAVDAEGADGKAAALFTREFQHQWDGQRVIRVVVATDGPIQPRHVPPGLTPLPGPGEAFVSHSVLTSATSNAGLAQLLQDIDVVGTVASDGLLGPAELRIVQGAPRTDDLAPVSHWGRSAHTLFDFGGPLMFFPPLVLLILLAPLLMALVLIARLDSASQRRRAQRLTVLGTKRWQTISILTWVPATATASGALVGVGVYTWAKHTLSSLPTTDLTFWPADLPSSLRHCILVSAALVSFVCFFVGSSLTGSRHKHTSTTTSRFRALFAALPLLAGLMAALLVAQVDLRQTPQATNWMLLAAAGCLFGLPGAVTLAIRALSAVLVRWSKSGTGLMVGRWLTTMSSASTRLSVALSVSVFAIAVAIPFAALLSQPTAPASAGISAARGLNLTIANADLSQDSMHSQPGVRLALPITSVADDAISALWATCTDVADLVKSAPDCSDRPSWISVNEGSIQGYLPDVKYPIALKFDGPVLRAPPTSILRARLNPEYQAMLFTGQRLPNSAEPIGEYLVSIDPSSQAQFEASIAAAAPTATYHNGFQDWLSSSRTFAGPLSFARVCATVGAAGLLLCLIAAFARDLRQRRKALSVLRRIGVRQATTLQIQALTQFASLVTPLYVGAISAAWVWQATGSLESRVSQSPGAYVALGIAPLAVAALVTVVSTPFAVRTTGTETDAHHGRFKEHATAWSS
jgi:hypothetical protein